MRFLSYVERFRPFLVSFSFVLAVLVAPLAVRPILAQSSPQVRKAPPPPPPPAAVDQELVIPYWTTETGWTSELQLRNNAVGQDLTVTPALRLPDGSETPLASVTIKSQEVKSVDVAAAISAAGAPQLIATYGSVALRYHSSAVKALYASIMIRAMGHAIAFHVDGSAEYQEMPVGSREGVWWLPNDTTSDYLTLTNQGKNALSLDLSLYDASGRENQQKVLLEPHATNRFSVRSLLQAANLAGSYGGIKISAASHAGSLDTLHFVFDTGANFSAILKMFDHDPNAKLAERDFARTKVWTLRAPMLALSNPDPALAFPPGTVLQPQIFIRNTTAKPIDAALRFNWRTGGTTGKAAGPQLHLLPYETRLVDVGALEDGTVLPKRANWTSVTLTSNALPDELMAVAASYDQTLKYGAQTPFSDQLSHEWKGGMWEFDPYHDSIITAGNGGTQPTQAAFTIFYNQGTQRYDLEQTLQPDEQMWIDVGKLIQLSVPDKNGKTLPRNLSSGSYEFRDLTHTGVGTLFEGKVIYDKTYGHAAYGCATCCGYSSAILWYDPILLYLPNPPTPDGVDGYNPCDLQYEDVSSTFYGNWQSLATSVITVDYYGTHAPQGPGSTTTETSAYLESTAHYPTCPAVYRAPQGSGYVAVLTCTPNSVTRGGSVTCSVSGQAGGSTFSNWQFKDSNGNTVTGSGTSSSWSGVVVTSGTVSVKVMSGNNTSTPSATVTVTARSGFAFTAVAAAQRANPYNAGACNISVPTSPAAGNFLGFSCLDQQFYQTPYLVGDNGPNNGFRYVYSASSSNNNVPTTFNFIIAGYLDDSGSEFAQKQWGNCGFISYNQLKSNTYEHESGNTTGHYATYKSTQDNSANNVGVAVEAIVGPPGQSETDFNNQVRTVANSKGSTIVSAAFPTPENFCNSDVRYDPACVFRGNINWPVYASCP